MTTTRTLAVTAPLAVAAGALLGCVAVAAADPTTPGGIIPLCPTKALLGIDCPGCGSARMIYSLAQFDIASAVRYNALALLAVVLLAWSWLAWLMRGFGRRIPTWTDWRWATLAFAVILPLWFVARILPFEPFLSLRV